MNALKRPVQGILSVLGYRLVRNRQLPTVEPQPVIAPRAEPGSGPEISRSFLVSFANFANLAQAYEEHLNGAGDAVIFQNQTRLRLLAQLLGTQPSEAYFIVQALIKCQDIDGDVCEFGVAQGITSALIANEIQAIGQKTLHLFDSFQGLPKPTQKDMLKDDIFSLGSIGAYEGTMSNPEDLVVSRLQSISFAPKRYVIHRGFIEQLLISDVGLPKRVSFAYVDLDFYEPTRVVLNFLHTVTPPGAIIIVDDYDFFSTGPKVALDEWLAEMNASGANYACSIPNIRFGNFAVVTKRG